MVISVLIAFAAIIGIGLITLFVECCKAQKVVNEAKRAAEPKSQVITEEEAETMRRLLRKF